MAVRELRSVSRSRWVQASVCHGAEPPRGGQEWARGGGDVGWEQHGAVSAPPLQPLRGAGIAQQFAKMLITRIRIPGTY